MADRVGQRLGNYRLIRLLGTGGFAEVYLGELCCKNFKPIKKECILQSNKGKTRKKCTRFL